MSHRLFFLLLFASAFACRQPQAPADQADGTITGKVLPGAAAGHTGKITVVAAFTSRMEQIDWSKNRDVLNSFGAFEITDLVGGKYYLAAFLDVNGNSRFDRGDFWGGYDADGDGRLDPVTLIGGKTLTLDIAMIARLD